MANLTQKKAWKKPFKWLWRGILAFFLFLAAYIALAYILSSIPVSAEADAADEVFVYIMTNGVHADVVVPIRSEEYDWSRLLPFSHTKGGDSTAQYLALGWGNKEFYLETPTWGDVRSGIVMRAAFGLGTSAMHATFYRRMKEDEDCKKIGLSKAQYARLIAFIQESLQLDSQGMPIRIQGAGYWKSDAFYEAQGRYSLLHTCNTWANNALKKCGQKAALWTPFERGIFYHYSD